MSAQAVALQAHGLRSVTRLCSIVRVGAPHEDLDFYSEYVAGPARFARGGFQTPGPGHRQHRDHGPRLTGWIVVETELTERAVGPKTQRRHLAP